MDRNSMRAGSSRRGSLRHRSIVLGAISRRTGMEGSRGMEDSRDMAGISSSSREGMERGGRGIEEVLLFLLFWRTGEERSACSMDLLFLFFLLASGRVCLRAGLFSLRRFGRIRGGESDECSLDW